MTDKIFDGICKAVSEEFNNLPVYTERVVQGVNAPCFMVRLVKSETQLFMGKRYIMNNKFKITYLDENRQNENLNCASVIERLCMATEVIDYGGGCVRGSNFKCEIEENHLDLYVDFNLFVYRHTDEADNTELMQELNIDFEI